MLEVTVLGRPGERITVRLGETLDEAHAYAKLCRVLVENLERDSQFLSRELTRRVGSGGSNIARANRRM